MHAGEKTCERGRDAGRRREQAAAEASAGLVGGSGAGIAPLEMSTVKARGWDSVIPCPPGLDADQNLGEAACFGRGNSGDTLSCKPSAGTVASSMQNRNLLLRRRSGHASEHPLLQLSCCWAALLPQGSLGNPRNTLGPYRCSSLSCFPLLSGLSALPAPLGLVPHTKLSLLSHPDLGPAITRSQLSPLLSPPSTRICLHSVTPQVYGRMRLEPRPPAPQLGGSLALPWLPQSLRKVTNADLHVPLAHLMAWRYQIYKHLDSQEQRAERS